MHIVNFQSSYFAFACLYLFLNVYYKYIMLRFSIPPLIKTPTPRFIRYPENFQPTLLLGPLRSRSFGTQE